ncbi:hypothetical protein [Halobellus sp. GM3]|uniref:hypothetical protein n=1 Tax=Halobellus sp. GM3 TaxID=3458410 RepID=UPI00403E09DF
MASSPPFIDAATGTVDTNQVVSEAVPLAKLILWFGVIALVPFALTFVFFGNSAFGAFLAVVGQFVLAIGTGIVLMYVVARGIDLAEA